MSEKKVKLGFDLNKVKIPVSKLMPTKQLPPNISTTQKYKQTAVSMGKIGIIEPLLVYPMPDNSGNYYLLDGHLRIQILDNMGIEEVYCLVSTEDEGFIANRFINRINAVQEHFMVFEAIQDGVSEEALADNLGVDIKRIKERANLLKGICKEVAELLKVRSVPHKTFGILKKMTAYCQIEAVETMTAVNDFSEKFARALLKTTPDEKLVDKSVSKDVAGMTPDQLVRIKTELVNLESDYKMAEGSFADDLLVLMIFRGYLQNLLNNERISEYLEREYREIFAEFTKVVEAEIT